MTLPSDDGMMERERIAYQAYNDALRRLNEFERRHAEEYNALKHALAAALRDFNEALLGR